MTPKCAHHKSPRFDLFFRDLRQSKKCRRSIRGGGGRGKRTEGPRAMIDKAAVNLVGRFRYSPHNWARSGQNGLRPSLTSLIGERPLWREEERQSVCASEREREKKRNKKRKRKKRKNRGSRRWSRSRWMSTNGITLHEFRVCARRASACADSCPRWPLLLFAR